jgi:hypothetical protein
MSFQKNSSTYSTPSARLAAMLAAGVLLLSESVVLAAHAAALLEPFTIIENGGWCWFQDERAIVFDGKMIVGGVAGEDRAGMSGGDIVAVISEWIGTDLGCDRPGRLRIACEQAPSFRTAAGSN